MVSGNNWSIIRSWLAQPEKNKIWPCPDIVDGSTLVIDERNQGAKMFFMFNVFLLQEFYWFSDQRVCDGGFIDVSVQPSAGGQTTVIGSQPTVAIQTSWTAECLRGGMIKNKKKTILTLFLLLFPMRVYPNP